MSSTIDIIHFTREQVKIGEVQVNEDLSIEGFLFENPVIQKIIAEKPDSVAFAVVVYPDKKAT